MSLPFNVRQLRDESGLGDPMGSDPGMFGLSRTERLYAFGACIITGFVLAMLGALLIFTDNITGFAITYTIGNLLAMFSLGFLVGFKRQMKMAFAPVRLVAGIIYLGLMVLTLVVGLTVGVPVLCLILVIIQFCSLVWYAASYIPFGRNMIKSMCGSLVEL